MTSTGAVAAPWRTPPLGRASALAVTLLLVLASLRGIIVLNTNLPAGTVYRTTAALLLLVLAVGGFLKRRAGTTREIALLRRLLQWNLMLGALNIAIDSMLGAPFELSVLYLYLAPYAVFLFVRVPTRFLHAAILIVTIGIAYSVTTTFVESMRGDEGYQAAFDYYTRLRPDVFEGLSRTGEYIRAGGYTGSYHDSANILGMVVCFLAVRLVQQRKLLDLVLLLFAVVGLTLTQSAANILVTIGVVAVFAAYVTLRNGKLSTYFYLAIAAWGLVTLVNRSGGAMGAFLARVGEEGDWEALTAHMDLPSLVAAIPYMFVGHAAAFGSDAVRIEVGLLKNLYQLGIVHAVLFFWMTAYPLSRMWTLKVRCPAALPAAAAVAFGFLSLLHYGSVYRVTNVFLFFAFHAICLVHIIGCVSRHEARQRDVADPADRQDVPDTAPESGTAASAAPHTFELRRSPC